MKLTRKAQTLGRALALAIVASTAANARAELMYALTVADELLTFDTINPSLILNSATITGLNGLEDMLGIDVRPASALQDVYGVSTFGRLFTINPVTGVATPVGGGSIAIAGTTLGVDFNPVPDRLRLVTDADENLRINPVTGALAATDTSLSYAVGDPNFGVNPQVVSVAYNNNFVGTPNTTLFGIDAASDILVRHGSVGGAPNSPNGGLLTTIGALGVNASAGFTGFDISTDTGIAYASFGNLGLFTIDLGTGAATSIGGIGGLNQIRDIAVPEPSTLGLLGLGGLALLLRRRR